MLVANISIAYVSLVYYGNGSKMCFLRSISQMVECCPAIFTGDQVFVELNRIVGNNLKQEYYESIDQHSLHLIDIFRSKRGNAGQLLTQTRTQEPTDITSLVLRGLPIVLGDNPKSFFKACFDSDGDHSFCHHDFGIPLEHEGAVLPSSLHLNPASIKIIIEGEVVMEGIKDLPKDVCILFGLAYALYLNYPKSTNTFQFTQQVLLILGHSELKPSLQT